RPPRPCQSERIGCARGETQRRRQLRTHSVSGGSKGNRYRRLLRRLSQDRQITRLETESDVGRGAETNARILSSKSRAVLGLNRTARVQGFSRGFSSRAFSYSRVARSVSPCCCNAFARL